MTAPSSPLRAALLVAAACVCAPAHAMTVNYQCIGYRPLSADLTPRKGVIHFEGHDWPVRRVIDDREARYVGRDGVTILARQRELTLVRGGESLRCVLLSDAVQQFATKPPGAASAASR
jgi:hypothetical protein